MSKVLLVTGGGRGIGARTALVAAERGYAVCVNYRRNRSAAEGVVSEIRSQGGRAVAVEADVANEADVVRLFATCDAELGPLDALVNNAGTLEKGALDTLTIGLAREVAEEGIRVNAVRPGLIYTELHASGGEPDRVKRLEASVPLQRGGTADEVARAILWLLSDESSYTTGTFIDVTGGR